MRKSNLQCDVLKSWCLLSEVECLELQVGDGCAKWSTAGTRHMRPLFAGWLFV